MTEAMVLKRRSVKTVVGIFLALVMVLAMFVPVQAATVKSLKAGTVASYKSKTNTDFFYKFTVPSDGLITVTNYGKTYIGVYAKASKSSTEYAYVLSSEAKSTFALAKGTYYLRASNGYKKFSDGEYYNHHKFKFTFKAVTPGGNYSLSKAKSLAAGSTVNVIQTRLNNYARWYKLSLSVNQKITFWTNNKSYVEVYDKSFNDVAASKVSDGKYATDSKLAKGTYYIRINPAYTSTIKNYTALRVTFKWK